jgi:hypothetical protein
MPKKTRKRAFLKRGGASVESIPNPFQDLWARQDYGDRLETIEAQLSCLKGKLEYTIDKINPKEIEVKVMCPAGYPKTPLYPDGEGVLADFRASIKKGTVQLHAFYVYPNPSVKKIALRQETNFVKGLGKKMLAFGMKEWLKAGLSSEVDETTEIELDASGGDCSDVEELKRIFMALLAEYEDLEELEERLDEFLSVFGAEVSIQKKTGAPPRLEQKVRYLCTLKNQMKLVEYYKTFGLTVVDDEENELSLYNVPMVGNFYDFLDRCGVKPVKEDIVT